MGNYVPSTQKQQEDMLNSIGVRSCEELFCDVPKNMLLSGLNMPNGISEAELCQKMATLSKKNKVYNTIFRGAGAYNHFIPAIVKRVSSKEEFVTAYTPYQAEISQGVLQSIFEYQTMICELTGMEVSNASVYDGATAAAEAFAMCREKNKNEAIILGNTHPEVIETVQTYCNASGMKLHVLPCPNGICDISKLEQMLTQNHAAVYVSTPNYYGLLENIEKIAQVKKQSGAKLIVGANPISLAALKTPADCGADIVVGEGQPLGMPLSFGGPYLGFMATTKALSRKLPGRIVGQTQDSEGKRCFVLTLQAREQHIRRERASSNICSNQALCALTAAVYMAAMGANGMENVAMQCYNKAHYLAKKLCEINSVKLRYSAEFFHEFVTVLPCSSTVVLNKLEENDILGGLAISENEILWCATEKNTKEEIETLVKLVKEVCE